MGSSRDSDRQIVLFFVTLLIFGVGVRFYLKKVHQSPSATAAHTSRDVASQTSNPDAVKVQFQIGVKHSGTPEAGHAEGSIGATLERELAPEGASESQKPLPPAKGSRASSSGFILDDKDEKRVFAAERDSHQCGKVEYVSLGSQHTQISKEEWDKVLVQFSKSKNVLKDWLKNDAHSFSEEAVSFLGAQLEGLKLEKPPILEQPDLSWRGIGVFSRNDSGSGSILLSPGFVRMLVRKPTRGAFEFTRLIAQVWAPCELADAGFQTAWDPLLKCLDIHDNQGCAKGTYSEAGWAVSSSLATTLTPSDCKLPAFQSNEKFACLKAHLGVRKEKTSSRATAGEESHE
jgi:hypothetical protein